QPIAFLERPAEARGEVLCDSALADTRDAHDNQDRRSAAMRKWGVQAMDAGRIGNKDRPSPADEQSTLDHSDQPFDPLLEAGRIGDRAEMAVENSIAAVRDEWLPGGRRAQICVGSERLEPCLCCLQTKGHGLDRYRSLRPETVHQFGLVDD